MGSESLTPQTLFQSTDQDQAFVDEADQTVHVLRSSPQTLNVDMQRLVNTPQFKRLDPSRTTYLKINANYDRDWPGCNTSRWFLDALLATLRESGFNEVIAIEGDLKLQPATDTIRAIHLDRILEKHRVPFLAIEHLPRESEFPAFLRGAQLISTPVLHTHTFAVISVAAKNLYGLLPIYREAYHGILSEKLLDLTLRSKVYSIVDGTVGLEGGSMRMGTPRRTDLIIGGWNPILVDVISSKVMGFAVEAVPYLRMAQERGMIKRISVQGDFSFESLPIYGFSFSSSFLSEIDLWLRRNHVTSRLFKYNSVLDKLTNHTRRVYTSAVYHRRKAHVFKSGDWMEYDRI